MQEASSRTSASPAPVMDEDAAVQTEQSEQVIVSRDQGIKAVLKEMLLEDFGDSDSDSDYESDVVY